MVLERIVARTRSDLEARKAARPLADWASSLAASDRSLEEALRRPTAGFVLECKKASPSRGLLRADFDPAALARAYAWAADAISVITDAPFFQGRLESLTAVREAVDLPVLCKDFVVDPYQVYEARRHGADAILLMLSVLDDAGYRRCREAAHTLQLDVLTEVHDEVELERALALDARVVGINNRNLATLEVDLAVTERLAPRVPADRPLVCESGLLGHANVLHLRPRVDAFLVGSSLVGAPDPAVATRQLVAGRFKVCGLTRPEDAAAAWEAGATWGGLIFAPESPRKVEPAAARAVQQGAPLRWVGVFVNAEPAHVERVARDLGLAAVQLHGEETPDSITDLRGRLPEGCEVWKGCRVIDQVPRAAETGADRLLLDAFAVGRRGGTGKRFDWSLLEGYPDRGAVILSGGLTPENAAEADALGAWALDVNSGVEEAPGRKSRERLQAFLAALRGRGREEKAHEG